MKIRRTSLAKLKATRPERRRVLLIKNPVGHAKITFQSTAFWAIYPEAKRRVALRERASMACGSRVLPTGKRREKPTWDENPRERHAHQNS